MKNFILKAYEWLIWSSKNADNYSVTIKMFITGGALTTILALFQISLPSGDIGQFIDAIVNVIKLLAALATAVGTGFGLARKLYFTFKGDNDLLNRFYK